MVRSSFASAPAQSRINRAPVTHIAMLQFTKGKSMKLTRLLIAVLPLTAPAAAPTAQTLLTPGLAQPVEILQDHWGIAHIYAKTEADLFFAQGYNVARDRLFQLEMWRRQATGTTAEVLGKRELNRDIGNRLFMFRGDMHRELSWYHPRGAAIIEAFVNGINAYIAETERNPALLTPEFKMLGITPAKWTPAVVVSRFNGLAANVDQELNMALAINAIGIEKVKDIEYFQPPQPGSRNGSGHRRFAAFHPHPRCLSRLPHAPEIHSR
jgi:penicillin amidase